MDFRGSILEWFVAAGAFVTAVATTATGFLVWRQHRWQKSRYDPTVECKAGWLPDSNISAVVTVRNKMPETIDVVSVEISKPKGSKISIRHTFNPVDGT